MMGFVSIILISVLVFTVSHCLPFKDLTVFCFSQVLRRIRVSEVSELFNMTFIAV